MSLLLLIAILTFAIVLVVCWRKSSHENMAYLDQYEMQDNYRNVPESWPIPYTSTTALYAAKREYLDRLFKGKRTY